MLTLYEQYKVCCPNSILKEGDLTASQMWRIIQSYAKRYEAKEQLSVSPPTDDQVKRYEAWKRRRRIRSFERFSLEKQERIIEAVKAYEEEKGPLRQLFLSGSYASGSWVDKNTSAQSKAIREGVKPITKEESDIDLIPVPDHGPLMVKGVDFSIAPQGEKFMIYENGKFL